MEPTIKTIIIEIDDNKLTKNKKISIEKVKKMRVETNTWGLNETELSHSTQLDIVKEVNNNNENNETNKYINKIKSHIRTKIGSYKQQDILKKKYDTNSFVHFIEVIRLLNECQLKCCYCSSEVYILYEIVRESKQWTLDRINNDIGHNHGNLVISCLECNLKRRRTNKDAFMFTKNMVIKKLLN
jgi:hypothetical protein